MHRGRNRAARGYGGRGRGRGGPGPGPRTLHAMDRRKMEEDMVTCEDSGEEEEEMESRAVKHEEAKDMLSAAIVKRKPEPNTTTPRPEADLEDTEEEDDEEEAAAAEPDHCSQSRDQGAKDLRTEEQGRIYHEVNEEAFCDRTDTQILDPTLADMKDYLVCLDASTCDLQFKMERDRYGGRPLYYFMFPFLWSGSRATHGVTKGKVYFEVKRTDNLPLREGYTEFPLLRVGWSVDRSGPQLGEDDLSFAYDSRGIKSTSSHFEVYGKSFREYDVIGCFADLEGDSVALSFSKNGEDLGQAFLFKKSSLKGNALLPHVICKGCAFQVNFGQRLQPWHQPREGFRFLHHLKSGELIRTPFPPKSIVQCEMLMMVGLPAAGKTTWAQKHAQENPVKHYMHLNVDRFIPQVKTLGLDPPEENSKVRDQHIRMATQCLLRVLRVASCRRANYIVDQCSVFKETQHKKLECFNGFSCKAVMLVPKEEEWMRRLELRRKEGEIYPEKILQDMQANFWIPKKTKMPFEEILCPELSKGEAQRLLVKFKKALKVSAVPSTKKRVFPKNANKRNFGRRSRPHPYQRAPRMPTWGPRARGFQNFREPCPPQQSNFFGPPNNMHQNRPQQWQDFGVGGQNWNSDNWQRPYL